MMRKGANNTTLLFFRLLVRSSPPLFSSYRRYFCSPPSLSFFSPGTKNLPSFPFFFFRFWVEPAFFSLSLQPIARPPIFSIGQKRYLPFPSRREKRNGATPSFVLPLFPQESSICCGNGTRLVFPPPSSLSLLKGIIKTRAPSFFASTVLILPKQFPLPLLPKERRVTFGPNIFPFFQRG